MRTNGDKDVRIMFVDNDLDYLELFEQAVKGEDTLLAIEVGAIKALSHLAILGYKVDAIVTDLAMGDMDGITFTEAVRRNERIRRLPPIDVYWFTGYGYDPNNPLDPITQAARELGVKKIFMKPYLPLDIINEVKAITEPKDFSNNGGKSNGSSGALVS
jgi:CheY-like chemotaxis protein